MIYPLFISSLQLFVVSSLYNVLVRSLVLLSGLITESRLAPGGNRADAADSGLAFGLVPCLVAFVLSSIGMAVPSNGGLGPWNIAVMFGLAVYGISDAQGTAFSMLQWSGQTVMLIILGIYTMLYISLSRKKEGADVLEGPKKPMA